MSLTAEQVRCIPLMRMFTDEQIAQLADIFERRAIPKGEVLFEAEQDAECFFLLEQGEVRLFDGEDERNPIRPPATFGELGALAQLRRNTRAVTGEDSVIWVVRREAALKLLESDAGLALPFFQNMVELLADKVRRDQLRLDDMRRNIIRTQKAMKRMRDYLLESEDTPVSDKLHNELEELIGNNRRVNYRVHPPKTLPAEIRFDDKSVVPVVEISRTHLSFMLAEGELPEAGSSWSGVLCLSGPEMPVSGKVLRQLSRRVDIKLDLLIDEYGAELDGYLTRVQMLDFMV